MNQPLSLEELKTEAQKRNHLVIRLDGETFWRPLKNWKGHPASAAVVYYLVGTQVLARTGFADEEHRYILG